MQKVVAVDIGNSAIKLAVKHADSIARIDSLLNDSQRSEQVAKAAAELNEQVQWLVCSVDKNQTAWLKEWVTQHRPGDDFRVIQASDIEIESLVEDREGLGRDRLLATWFAATKWGWGADMIVIDAGTAVTIDVCVMNQGHVGGLIFPGSNTCLSALSSQASALPDLTKRPVLKLSTSVEVGKSTESAILVGVHQMQLFGIVSIVRSLELQHQDAVVCACGGALESVAHLLPEHWNYDRDFLIKAIFWLKRSL